MNKTDDFLNPGKEYSVLAFWFLSGTLEDRELKRQISEMTEKGVYGGFMHPRAYLKTQYSCAISTKSKWKRDGQTRERTQQAYHSV